MSTLVCFKSKYKTSTFPFSVIFTKDNEIALMTHMFALCLHVDNFASDTTLLATDLRESVNKYVYLNYFFLQQSTQFDLG